MNVRSATSDDFEAITAVARDTWHDTYDELEADMIDRTVDNWYTDDSMPLEAPGRSFSSPSARRNGPRMGVGRSPTNATATSSALPTRSSRARRPTSSGCTSTRTTRARGSAPNSTSS